MATPAICTYADVYNRAGGQAALSQLIDPEGTGTYSTTVLDLAISDASNLVVMAAGVQSVLSGLTQAQIAERFPELVTCTALKALPLCWDYGTSGRARPEHVQGMDARADVLLEALRARRAKHGATDYSSTPNQQVNSNVDNDPNQTRGLGSLASWSRGFV